MRYFYTEKEATRTRFFYKNFFLKMEMSMNKKSTISRIATVIFAFIPLQKNMNACVHTDLKTGLSWKLPTHITIKNTEYDSIVVQGITLHAGDFYTFQTQNSTLTRTNSMPSRTKQGFLPIQYAHQRYKLAYPTCQTCTDSLCEEELYTRTITTSEIKEAIRELICEQKEKAWLAISDILNLRNGPVDEISILNDSPYPVKITRQVTPMDIANTDIEENRQTVEPGQSYSTVVATAEPSKTRSNKSALQAKITRILIDQQLGEGKKYELCIPRRTPSDHKDGSNTNAHRASKTRPAITQITIALSMLHNINTGFVIERADTK
jgi:hypothetical protein